jgi:hypothetical protein
VTGLVETELVLLLENGYRQTGVAQERLSRNGETQDAGADDGEVGARGGLQGLTTPDLSQHRPARRTVSTFLQRYRCSLLLCQGPTIDGCAVG